MNANATIHVELCPPLARRAMQSVIEISPDEWHKAFAPLPRDRELPDYITGGSSLQAARMADERQHLARNIAAMLAANLTKVILEAVESQDTVNGYPKTPEKYHSP